MATTKRWGAPWCWVTWLTPLLAGDACFWKAWFAARYKFQKQDRNFDLSSWAADHTAMIRARVEQLQADGWSVTVEDQNSFAVKVSGVTISGKPDILALKGDDALVVDGKTGKARDSDFWQVLIYMRVLPMVRPDLEGKRLRGEVQYRDRSLGIEPEELNADRRAEVGALLMKIAAPAPPNRTPSVRECGFCDIRAADCPERMEAPKSAVVEVEAF